MYNKNKYFRQYYIYFISGARDSAKIDAKRAIKEAYGLAGRTSKIL